MSVDTVLLRLWQGKSSILLWFFVVNVLRATISSFSFNSFMWANAKPRSIRCRIPPDSFLNDSVPFEIRNGELRPSQCLQFVNFSSEMNVTVPCQDGYEYESFVDSSVTTEWDLVCDRKYLSSLADSSFFMLSLVGALISNALADRFGRKPVFICGVLALSGVGVISAWAPNVEVFIFLRMVTGPLQQAVYTIGYIYVLEQLPTRWRATMGLVSELFWALGGVCLCAVAFFVRSWRVFFYATTLPFSVCFLLFWIMPESVSWMLAKGRIETAKKTLLKAAWNNRTRCAVSELMSSSLVGAKDKEEEVKDEPAMYPFYYSVTDPNLRLTTLVNAFIWFILGCAYLGLQVEAMTVGNPYLNFFLISVVDVPGILVSIPLSSRFGRKMLLAVAFAILGVSIAMVCISNRYLTVVASIFFCLVGKFVSAFLFTVIFLHTSELYPTSLRSVGMAIGTSFTRLGVTAAPFLVMLKDVRSWLPPALLSVASALCAAAVLVLPETKDKPLPRSLEDIGRLHGRKGREEVLIETAVMG